MPIWFLVTKEGGAVTSSEGTRCRGLAPTRPSTTGEQGQLAIATWGSSSVLAAVVSVSTPSLGFFEGGVTSYSCGLGQTGASVTLAISSLCKGRRLATDPISVLSRSATVKVRLALPNLGSSCPKD